MTTPSNNQTLFELIHLYSDYAAAVDSAQWEKWIDFFTDECEYKIQPRENYDRGFPLCTLALLSKNMLKDRVYGIHETLYHDPYYQRHVVGLPIIREEKDNVI
ncbi:MAG: aromatic-ring-hydroxylating dioxygenase subunit beta, partial [bacterium]